MTHIGRDQHRRVFTWTPLSYLGITQRFHTIAEREGWKIALDFYRMTDDELLKIKGLGKETLQEIRAIFRAPDALPSPPDSATEGSHK